MPVHPPNQRMKPPNRMSNGLEARDNVIPAPRVNQFMREDHFQPSRRRILNKLLRKHDGGMNDAEQPGSNCI